VEIKSDTGCSGCPMVRLLDFLSGRWALPVLFHLHRAQGPIRFGELRRSIGRVTQKELTRTLREFELRGLVTRTVYAEVPPRVEYGLTPLGDSLKAPLAALAAWSEEHPEAVAVIPQSRIDASSHPADEVPELALAR